MGIEMRMLIERVLTDTRMLIRALEVKATRMIPTSTLNTKTFLMRVPNKIQSTKKNKIRE